MHQLRSWSPCVNGDGDDGDHNLGHVKIKSSLGDGDAPQLTDLTNYEGFANAVVARRNFLVGISTAATLLSSQSQSANAIDNPLNLKGTFWETGQLYEKSTPLPDDDDDFFAILDNTVEALHAPTLVDSITEGKYGQASRLLRGGLISESKIRLAANALIDAIPEDDGAIYKSNESFRLFLRYLDVLDAEVEAASRPLLGGGGDGGGDPRMKILTRLGEVEDALKEFLKNVRGGLG